MNKNEEIEKLFKDYVNQHANELVIFDGVITEKELNVLFILKESNIGEKPDKKGIDFTFWFQEVYKAKNSAPNQYYTLPGKTLTRQEKSAQTKYYNCIMQIINDLYPNKNKDDIGISYININKNGGGSNCNNIGINEWLDTDYKHKFLLDQIDFIQPDKIVIFSCNNSNPKIKTFAEELKQPQYPKNWDVITKEYHPSRYKNKKQESPTIIF